MFVSDGYIRLTYADFCTLSLQRHMVWQDPGLVDELREQGLDARVAGYCEWVSVSLEPKVSLGWAWFVAPRGRAVMLAPGGISANIMLCTDTGAALGVRQTAQLLHGWLSSQAWQREIILYH